MEEAMRTGLVCILIITQIVAHMELVFIQRTEGQSVELSWSAEQTCNTLTDLHLYHTSTWGQMTLLSLAEGNKLRVSPEYRGRLEISGGLSSPQVNVTISHLQRLDAGLYTLEFAYSVTNHSCDLSDISRKNVFLLVEVAGRTCCSSCPALLYVVAAAVGFLLLTLLWLAALTCVRPRHKPQPPIPPIYEEMTRKQRCAGKPQNNQQHLEETGLPVYSNLNIRQDNHYACPRQTASSVHF